MAKIFSAEEVRLGHIPRLNDFEHMADVFMALPSPEPELEPIERMVYGSVDGRTHNIRSDLDCLIIWPTRMSFDGIKKYLDWLKDASGALHVPLEPLAVRRDIADRGEHGLEALFMGYLRQVEPDVRLKVGMPATRLALPGARPSATEIIHNFAAAKTEKFTKAATNTNIDYNTFQRALELVRALDRKFARMPGITPATDTLPKIAVKLGLNGQDISAVHDATQYLNATDSAYNVLLAEAMSAVNTDPDDPLEEYTAKLEQWYPGVIQNAIKLSIGSHAIINAAIQDKVSNILYD